MCFFIKKLSLCYSSSPCNDFNFHPDQISDWSHFLGHALEPEFSDACSLYYPFTKLSFWQLLTFYCTRWFRLKMHNHCRPDIFYDIFAMYNICDICSLFKQENVLLLKTLIQMWDTGRITLKPHESWLI